MAPLLSLVLLVVDVTPVPAQTSRPAIAGRRIVKHFDFNEGPAGNYDPTPMFWRRQTGPGFASFLEGQFDERVYHTASPSFRMALDGGSVAYSYEGGDIAVRTQSEYLVVAWVRTAGLDTARAYLTAGYLDRKRTAIPGTLQRSDLAGGGGKDSDWQPLTISLPGNVPGARYIGLTLWLAQERVWNTAERPPRAIDPEDIQGAAWFDEVTVYRLPRASLISANPGNVFEARRDVELLAEISDPDGLNISGEIILRDAENRIVDRQPVPLLPLDAREPHRIRYRDLPAGLYRAELQVTTRDTTLVRRELTLVRLPEPFSPPGSIGRRFGIVLRDIDGRFLDGQTELLRRLQVEYVKLPVWHAQASTEAQAGMRSAAERYLTAIVDSHADPIGMLMDDPTVRASSASSALQSMLSILSEPAALWKPLIAPVWLRDAGLVAVWQLGSDEDVAVAADARVPAVVDVLRREMTPLMGQPILATVTSALDPAVGGRRADFESIYLPETVPATAIEAHLRPLLKDHPGQQWVTIATSADRHARELQLSNLARRLVETVWQRPAAVFVTAPWECGGDALSPHVFPAEEYLVFRTVSDVLGDASPVARWSLDGRAECFVFDRTGRAVLMIWDDTAPPEGRAYTLPLGKDVRHIDIWGRPLSVEQAGELQTIHVGTQPTFLLNTPTWLLEFRRQFSVQPALVESRIDLAAHDVVLRNTWGQSVSGTLRLVAPADWDVRPRKIPFALGPGEQLRQSITLRFPMNASSGATPLVGEFELDADRRYRFCAPAWFELGLADVDFETYIYRSGNRATIRLLVTNRSDQPVHFEGHLVIPGRERVSRLFTNFLPRQTVEKTFHVDAADQLVGQRVRLSLKEVQGNRVWNRVFTIP